LGKFLNEVGWLTGAVAEQPWTGLWIAEYLTRQIDGIRNPENKYEVIIKPEEDISWHD
jgi:hypothetical protein